MEGLRTKRLRWTEQIRAVFDMQYLIGRLCFYQGFRLSLPSHSALRSATNDIAYIPCKSVYKKR